MTDAPALKRSNWRPRPVPTVFVDWTTGAVVTDAGGALPNVPARATVGALLKSLHERAGRVYLTNPPPPAERVAWTLGNADELAPWREDDAGHYLGSDRDVTAPVGRYRLPLLERRVEIRCAAEWFGEGALTARQARDGWTVLGDRLARRVEARDDGGYPLPLLGGPVAAGQDALVRLLPTPKDGQPMEWPVLPAELRELIRSTSPQGRIEHYERKPRSTVPGVFIYDGRLMYAGCCRELGSGPVIHDEIPEPFPAGTRGRYLVRATVPDDWEHVGLLMAPSEARGRRWETPSEPGRQFVTWCDAYEAEFAMRHGWRVEILERLRFTRGNSRPLDRWAKTLGQLAEELRTDADLGHAGQLAAKGARAMIVRTIGSFHRETGYASHSGPTPPAGVHASWDEDAGVWTWREPVALGARSRLLIRPEWSSAIYARAHVRLLDCPTGTEIHAGALAVRRAQILAMRTDALYLTVDPRWPDPPDKDGRAVIGRLRLKAALPKPQRVAARQAFGRWLDGRRDAGEAFLSHYRAVDGAA